MINVLQISDIHFENKNAENEGVVIDAFFEDLKNTLMTNKDDNFCVISGDLVNKGCNNHVYDSFYNNFIVKLQAFVPLSNILVVAGNHDLNRQLVENNFEEHKQDIDKKWDETEFNDYVDDEINCRLLRKFQPFNSFCKNKLLIADYNPIGYHRNLTSDVSFFFLNSALCSSGGFNDVKDEGNLRIDTRKLNEWILGNKGRTKVLVMHHPIEHLNEDLQNELNNMCHSGIDYVISGHIHYKKEMKNEAAFVFVSPQLFSSKNDLNGYSILHFDDNRLENIEYRQWSERNRMFVAGVDFAPKDNGKWINPSINANKIVDSVEEKLQEDFDNAMSLFDISPNWIERKLSVQKLNFYHEKKEKDLDYLDILNSGDSYQIVAPEQFGLTCFSYYLVLKAYKILKQKWVYVNAKDWNLSKVDPDVKKALNHIGTDNNGVNCVVIDDWKSNYRDNGKITAKLKKLFPDKRFIFFSHATDPVSVDLNNDADVVKTLYLREINRKELRMLVNSVDCEHIIAEEDVVVERLNQDIIALNMHRTPHNSLQFLKSYKNNFEERPINRTKVLDGVLRSIFDNPGNLKYGGEIDDGNCKFIMGYFCQQLVKRENLSFTENDFYQICNPFVESQYNSTNLSDLLQVFINNQVVEPIGNSLQFRQIYWVEYFVAIRMGDDEGFAQEMLGERNGLFNPDLIDFYTGIDGKNKDVATRLTEKLDELGQSVISQVGIANDFDPFKDIKWHLSEIKEGITQTKIEESIKNSRMPDDIKEAVADRNFDSVKPYTQQIYTFLDDYKVRNLMQLLTSSSRAIRNSEFISPEIKEKLIEAILNGWETLMRVLSYIAPLLAKTGYGGYGGANFKLEGNFPREYAECLKQIIVSMPFNIVQWYKNDFFSDKLVLLLKKQIEKNGNNIARHLLALIICDCKPNNFKDIISSYIGSIDKNTFYLGDLYNTLRNNYSYEFMSRTELNQTEFLIKSCYIKHFTGSEKPGKGITSKEQYKGILPPRNIENN